MTAKSENPFHLRQGVIVTIVLFIITYGIAGVWGWSRLDNDVKNNGTMIIELKKSVSALPATYPPADVQREFVKMAKDIEYTKSAVINLNDSVKSIERELRLSRPDHVHEE